MVMFLDVNKQSVTARGDKLPSIQSKITYAPQDQFLHLTLWDGDYCVSRVSLHIDKFLAKLGVKFSRSFALDLELESDTDGEVYDNR